MEKKQSFLSKVSKKKIFRGLSGILALLALSIGSIQINYPDLLMGSVLDQPDYTFEGAVPPFDEMLDYTELSSSEREMTYSELKAAGPENFIPSLLPKYTQENLTFDISNIDWSNPQDIEKMNLQYNITVPYAGNYKLDSCGVGCGSHPGIDWIVPEGTPVRSAVAGEVIKVREQSSGFGNHIVVKTENAPRPDNPDEKTTIYFSYSHLSDIYVNEGDIVEMGEIIALSGQTATDTAHLDWQLALEDVPWTPYWPFTWSEAEAAGLDFWGAVNEGLGIDNVYAYMSDPAEYVLKYNVESYVAPEESTPSEENIIEVDSENVDALIDELESDAEEPIETDLEDEDEDEEESEINSISIMDIADMEVDMPNFILTGDKRQIEITLYDAMGEILKDPQFTEDINISFSEEDVAKLNRNFLDKQDFKEGIATLELYGELEGETNIIFTVSGSTFTTTPLNVIDDIQPFAKFGVASDGYFIPNVKEIIQIQAWDLEGNPTPDIRGDGIVEIKVVEGEATLSPSQIHTDDFKTGIAEVELYATDIDDIVLEVKYGKKITESKAIEVQDFTDLSRSAYYYTSVNYLRSKGTISGYPDGTFQPDREVSRIEALKMIFSGFDLDLVLGRTVSFKDTAESGEWYSDYLATAADKGVVQGYPDGSFKPTQGVNRVEFLKMLFTSMDISVDPVVIEDPSPDVDNLEWYAPYVQYALEKNIFPSLNSNSNFNPGNAMTRAEVAEVIYRLIVVLYNDGAAYSIQLDIPKL